MQNNLFKIFFYRHLEYIWRWITLFLFSYSVIQKLQLLYQHSARSDIIRYHFQRHPQDILKMNFSSLCSMLCFCLFMLLAEINVKWQTQKSVNLANYLFLVGHSPHQSTNPHQSIVNCVLATPLFYDLTLNLRSKTTNTFVQKRKIQVWRVVQCSRRWIIFAKNAILSSLVGK